jgi:hypothetical protein
MAKKQTGISASDKWRPWIDARRNHHLSHAHIQMARELGMNPRKFGGLDNHRQERWKAPLPIFIESLYFKRFGKQRPDAIKTIEEIAAGQRAKQDARKATRQSGPAGSSEGARASDAAEGSRTRPSIA